MDDSEDVEEELTHKFLEVLRECSHPCDSFPEGSKELKLAEAWLQYLIHYHCHNNVDRRMRTTFMFGLSKCISQKRLRGPFTKLPPQGRLSLQFKHKKDIESVPEEVLCFRCSPRSNQSLSSIPNLLKLFELPYCPCFACKDKIKTKVLVPTDWSQPTAMDMKDYSPFDLHQKGNRSERRSPAKKPKVHQNLFLERPVEHESKNKVRLEDCDQSSSSFRLRGGKDENDLQMNGPNSKEGVLAAYLRRSCQEELNMPFEPPTSSGSCVIERTYNISSEKFNGFVSDMFLCNKVKYNCKSCNKSLTTVEMQYLENAENKGGKVLEPNKNAAVEELYLENHEIKASKELQRNQDTSVEEPKKPKNIAQENAAQEDNNIEPDRLSTTTYVLDKEPQREHGSNLSPELHQLTQAFTSVCETGMIENFLCKEGAASAAVPKTEAQAQLSPSEAWKKDIEVAMNMSCHDNWQQQKRLLLERPKMEIKKPKKAARIGERYEAGQEVTAPAVKTKIAVGTCTRTDAEESKPRNPNETYASAEKRAALTQECPYCVKAGTNAENQCRIMTSDIKTLQNNLEHIYHESVKPDTHKLCADSYSHPVVAKEVPSAFCGNVYPKHSCYASLILQRYEQAHSKVNVPLLHTQPNIRTTAFGSNYGGGVAFCYQNKFRTMSSSTTTTTTSSFEIGSSSGAIFFIFAFQIISHISKTRARCLSARIVFHLYSKAMPLRVPITLSCRSVKRAASTVGASRSRQHAW